MDAKELKKLLKCISLSGLIVASVAIVSSCRTSYGNKKGVESEKEKTSCSGDHNGGENDEGKTSCGGEGETSCG